ncbi:MAG: hypothetical protein ABIU86_06770 [Gemmatimonadaceae bacterium]
MLGSRFLWEINNWQYPHTERGDAQTDNPNDDSADGADMMAMLRYLVMAYWEEKLGVRVPFLMLQQSFSAEHSLIQSAVVGPCRGNSCQRVPSPAESIGFVAQLRAPQ